MLHHLKPKENSEQKGNALVSKSTNRKLASDEMSTPTGLDHFHATNRGGIVLGVSNKLFDDMEDISSCLLQMSSKNSLPLLLVAHGDAQAASHIKHISKATQPEMRSSLADKIEAASLLPNSEEMQFTLLCAMGLSKHDASVVIDTYGDISSMAGQSAKELYENTPIDFTTAEEIEKFWNQDTIVI